MRPRMYAVLLIFFLLPGIVFSFTPSKYIYGSEGNVTVTYEDFILNSTNYSLVYFDGTETFLLKEGEPLNDSSEISQILYDYYKEKYYPTDEEIEELRLLIERYNASRNDGYDWKNKEEYACRVVLFTDGRIEMYGEPLWCHDDESCDINAKLLYQAYHEAVGWRSYEVALQPLKDFSYASFGTDAILANITEKLDSLDPGSAVNAFDYISESIPTLRDYLEDIESTIYRTPRLNDTEDREDCQLRCYALCPSFDLDERALDEIEDKVEELTESMGPFEEYAATASGIYNRTLTRFGYYYNTTTSSHYNSLFSPLEETGIQVEEDGDYIASIVTNTSFMLKLENFKNLRSTIREKIDTNDFAGLDADIENYREELNDIRNASDSMYLRYNETLDAKNTAGIILFEVGTKDLGAIELEKLEELKNRTAQLDEEFTSGLTAAELDGLEENYSQVADEALQLLASSESSSTSKAITYFRGLARKINDGIAQFAESTNITNAAEIPENQYTTLGSFSLLVFLSFASILLLFFLYPFAVHKYTRIRYVVLAAFVLGVVIVGLFAGFLFVFMQKTSTDATMDEFLVDLDKRENIAIVVDAKLLTQEEEDVISGCAAEVAAAMRENNKTVTIYYLESAGSCTESGEDGDSDRTEEACLSAIEEADSVIYLNPSNTIESPKLYTTYLSRAEIYGTSDYYLTCPLSAVFK